MPPGHSITFDQGHQGPVPSRTPRREPSSGADGRARRRGDEPTRIRPPGEPSATPVGAPLEHTREPSTTGVGAWQEHDFTGRVFNKRFELKRRLGKGGMATVYETFDKLLHKHVAVKVLNPEHKESADLNRRFLEEARAISQLEHDHIVDVIDIGEEDGLVYLVMELLKGEDLGETLWQDGPLHWWRVLDIGAQICEALAAAHGRGIIHRDIKPANCMRIAYRGESDFIKVL
ncbi:MAG: serine/threonine protein kinase, partial [Myxococcales bacterium]|nr:serine/threonine protein kinase [Myxococcales bacterium]